MVKGIGEETYAREFWKKQGSELWGESRERKLKLVAEDRVTCIWIWSDEDEEDV